MIRKCLELFRGEQSFCVGLVGNGRDCVDMGYYSAQADDFLLNAIGDPVRSLSLS